MVNRDRVQLLVDALESDEFEQCKGSLRLLQSDGTYAYCCLGVATEVALRHGLSMEVADKYNLYAKEEPSSVWNHSNGQMLADEVVEWYGFEGRTPELKGVVSYIDGVKRGHPAHQWNDSYDANFRQIADMFREKYLAPETAATD